MKLERKLPTFSTIPKWWYTTRTSKPPLFSLQRLFSSFHPTYQTPLYHTTPPNPLHTHTHINHPTTALPPKSPSINAPSIPGSSRTKTANTSIGGASPNPCARFHRLRREMPMQGPYCDDRSKWRRIFSWRERDFWCTGWDCTPFSLDSHSRGEIIGVLLRFREVVEEEGARKKKKKKGGGKRVHILLRERECVCVQEGGGHALLKNNQPLAAFLSPSRSRQYLFTAASLTPFAFNSITSSSFPFPVTPSFSLVRPSVPRIAIPLSLPSAAKKAGSSSVLSAFSSFASATGATSSILATSEAAGGVVASRLLAWETLRELGGGREGLVILLLRPNARVCWAARGLFCDEVDPSGRPRRAGGILRLRKGESCGCCLAKNRK